MSEGNDMDYRLEMRAEIQALRAENERLKAENAALRNLAKLDGRDIVSLTGHLAEAWEALRKAVGVLVDYAHLDDLGRMPPVLEAARAVLAKATR